MQREELPHAEQYARQNRRRRIWRRIVSTLACIVVFCTTYALILPAITLEKACGLEEHVHTESCYRQLTSIEERQLICPLPEEEAHHHTDDCYAAPLLEEGHTHTADCYTARQGELICGLEEDEGHAHEDGCYDEEGQLICELEESEGHRHDDDCYDWEDVLVCELEESDPVYGEPELACGKDETDGHIHTEDCFLTTVTELDPDVLTCPLAEDENHTHSALCYGTWELICGKAEHVHSDACTPQEEDSSAGSGPKEDAPADTETAADWEASFALAELTDDWRENTVAIAETQLGYHESEENYILAGDGTQKGYTRYGAWYGDPYGDWCAMFASFCLHYANVEDFPLEGNCQAWIELLEQEDVDRFCPVSTEEAALPVPGDLIFFDLDRTEPLDAETETAADAADHVGIVQEILPATETEPLRIRTIEGNINAMVCQREYDLDDPQILGFGRLPEPDTEQTGYLCGLEEHSHTDSCHDETGELICGLEEHIHSEECLGKAVVTEGKPAEYGFISELADHAVLIPAQEAEGDPASSHLFHYGDDTVNMTIRLTGDGVSAKLPTGLEQSEETDWTQGLVLAVIPLDDDSEVYLNAAEYAAENVSEDEDLYGVLAYEFCFFLDGLELDVTGCEITVDLSPTEAAVENAPSAAAIAPMTLEQDAGFSAAPMAMTAAPDVSADGTEAPEEQAAEMAIRLSVLQNTGDGITETDSTLVSADEAAGTVMRFTLQSTRLAVTLSGTANPHFTVQYYANIPRVRWKNENVGALSIIDTDNGGKNQGGNLPQNGVNLPVKYLAMENSKAVMDDVLTEVYQHQDCEYISAPNLTYFNSLYENGNYTLKEVWVLMPGHDPSSTNRDDWNIYSPSIHFTNRPNSQNENTILIAPDTVIRLVYDITASAYQNEVNFYDYDITNGKVFSTEANAQNQTSPLTSISSGGTYYVKTDSNTGTAQQGINSAGNYSGSGTKLAFGNNNTRVALGTIKWDGNELNKFNEINRNTGGNGCTFGLASSLDSNNNIRFSSGVNAPSLFGSSAATGKTMLSGYLMDFQRQGDTYTLTNVTNSSGYSATGDLSVFTATPYWDQKNYPGRMVYANNFWPLDSAYSYKNDYVQGHDPKTGPATTASGTHIYAVGNGGAEHFPSSDNGVPHNNYFGMNFAVQFTLVEEYIGPLEYLFFGDDDMWVFLDGRLVCDIGGVHSSVGEYVNLWDYIEKGTAGTHTLSFFYTERGASGSSCYMQFTLPSVSSATPEQTTGALRVEKKVEGILDSQEEFRFDIRFTDASGQPLRDDYSYTRYDAQGNKIKSDVIIYDGGSFELQDGEYVVIRYLPVGTRYIITEADADGYTAEHKVNTGVITSGPTVEGDIEKGRTDTVYYINTARYELPQTGGSGTALYTVGGAALMAAALIYTFLRRRKEAA